MVSRAEFDPFRLAGGKCEGERVKDELVRAQRELVASEVVDTPRDLDLAVRGARHSLLVNGERDHARAVVADRRQHGVAPDAAVLEVDAVDDAAARIHLERRPDDVGVGTVDHQRRVDAHLQRLDDSAHLLRLIAALGDGDAQVERMRATLHLRPRDAEDAVVVVGEQQAFDGARTLCVDPLTDEQGCRLLAQLNGVHAAGEMRFDVGRDARTCH